MTTLWTLTKDGDLQALELFERHYSATNKHRKHKKFVGPGEKMVLVNDDYTALFVWRKFIHRIETGVNCAVFRNESLYLSSLMILDAEHWAWERWPEERLYTYVDSSKVRSSNPGFCFKMAGWRQCGITKRRHLLIFEKMPIL